MNITDELRKFANDWDWLDHKSYESEQKLMAIADRIDAEYQKVLDKHDNEPFEVWAIQYDDCRWKVYDHLGNCYSPSLLRRHAQTVEDVQAENEHMLLKAFNIIGEFLEENVKLRKLCADTWYLFTERDAVNPYNLSVVDAVRDQMRELGVKVD